MDSVVAVVGTLLGIVLGISGAYLNQRLGYQREFRERLATTRRQTYVEFMSAVHEMFIEISRVFADLRLEALTLAEARSRLHGVSGRDGQASLENLRLVGSDGAAAAAADLWSHMRRESVPTGTVDRDEFKQWRSRYWVLRRALIDAARTD